MTKFALHTIETAPEAAKSLLKETEASWKFIPKLHATLAESPIALQAYATLFALVGKSSLSPIEQQVGYLAVSVFHECGYCTAGHTFLAQSVAVPAQAVEALRNGAPIADARLEALRRFAEAVVRERGFVKDEAVDAFLDAGFTRAQVLEVVVLIATKTISNYVNHLTHTPPESFMSDPSLGWVAPQRPSRK